MIKFITEEYLRDLYRKDPFDTYKLEQGQRLTPGAAEYLSDKGIKLNNDSKTNKLSKINTKISQKDLEEEPEKLSKETVKNVGNIDEKINLNKKLCCKLKSIEAAFLVTSSEILREDIILAQNIINLGRKISNIRNVLDGKGTLESVCVKECTGINSTNSKTDLGDCFEITEFHMQLPKSNAILKMNVLRCTLQELKFEIMDIYKDDEILKNKIIDNVNSIINSLSQLICLAVGGKECQREN
ncbi:cobalamin adenosyltransferase [Clostridium tepidum]|uniref:Cobalamin adenosyltransferase n=1 Tax=Clostridium tepidum TaxID=1962263 RepID=A0A1S9IE12_9CLOT|nr:cobalamin adenosyltransferase [Clostridium tepidum]MCR1934101.1 cobalamin adenosyltransferase [Clostridium tepidum]MDU6877903.1 cobalamin adenosyltransferase [Clostridium botulinum]OOO63254.1 cobalamin adenosyltransferase [Clostridium tepidum]OOO68549.1 cobalamin adenosyltransferase [Clostridium tepidum]